jgi:hypothetical protein
MVVENDGVARIVAAGVARREIKGRGQVVDHLAFSFVAPLGADDRNRFSPALFHRSCHPNHTNRTFPLRLVAETLQEGRLDWHHVLILRRTRSERQAQRLRSTEESSLSLAEDFLSDVGCDGNAESLALIRLDHQQDPQHKHHQTHDAGQGPSHRESAKP